jgi:UPF0716 protein FxsA
LNYLRAVSISGSTCYHSPVPLTRFEPLRPSSPLFGLLVFAAWIGAEIIAFNLVASWTGGGLAFFLFIMKSVLGGVFVTRVIRHKLSAMLRRGGIVLDGKGATEGWLKGLGAILLIVPGFITGVIGLALLTPSVRKMILGRASAKASDPRNIDLNQADWREIPEASVKRLRRRRKPQASD